MQVTIPLDKILERLREEQRPDQPALRLHAPEPPHDQGPPRRDISEEAPERGVAIIDFTI
tara:strand:+ start:578 stop:757 length:180 start_codon:yes stop_codon:yes gene_type:complete